MEKALKTGSKAGSGNVGKPEFVGVVKTLYWLSRIKPTLPITSKEIRKTISSKT